MTKKTFCTIMDNIRNIEKKFEYLENFLGQPICESDFFLYTGSILDALGADFELQNIDVCADLIFDFAYNHNWGFGDMDKKPVVVNIDGIDHEIRTSEELYDVIMEITGN